MSKGALPVVSGREAVRAFERLGYERSSYRGKGSHVGLRCPGRATLFVPMHGELAKGTLRSLIRKSGFSVEEFRDAL